MAYYNSTAFLWFFLGAVAAAATTTALSYFQIGSSVNKAATLIAFGLSMAVLDLRTRLVQHKEDGWVRFFDSDYGGNAVIPSWILGLVFVFGGITVIFEQN